MESVRFKIPEVVVARAKTQGVLGFNWLEQLDSIVAKLEAAWGFTAGAVQHGGSESLVTEARFDNGSEAILKIGVPGSTDLAQEVRTYQIANGCGYAKLIEHDPDLNAILVEKLGAPLAALNLPIDSQIEIICETLTQAWIVPDNPSLFFSGKQKGLWLANYIFELWIKLDRPCAHRTIDKAIAVAHWCASAHMASTAVLVHGDAHASNTLLSGDRFKLIDPDGMFAHPAVDLAVLMREWSGHYLAGDPIERGKARCQKLAILTGVDPILIWAWGFVESVSTGLTLLQLDLKEEGDAMLAVAGDWARTTFGRSI